MLLMAPRRDSNSANNITSILLQQHQDQTQQQFQQSQQQTFLYSSVSSLLNRGSLLLESSNGSTTISNNNNTTNMPPMQTGNLNHTPVNGGAGGGGNSGSNNGHHPQQHAVSNISNNSNINNNQNGNGNINVQEQYTRCCYPNGECLKLDACLIPLDDLSGAVRVLCNNENCNMGQYMHGECFDAWEQSILVTLKSMGRARAWSDRQRAQNLWTKKGYDLVYKACVCKCGHGHIRKDIEWIPPPAQTTGSKSGLSLNGTQYANMGGGGGQRVLLASNGIANGNSIGNSNNSNSVNDEEDKKKKKKRNRNNNATKPILASINSNGLMASGQQQQQQPQVHQQPSQVGQQQQQQQLLQQVTALNSQQNIGGNISNGISAICTPNNAQKPHGNAISTNPNTTLMCGNNNNQINSLNNSSVGVIGSGLHNNNGNVNQPQLQQQQQLQQQSQLQTPQQQQQQQTIVSLNNILGLDLCARSGSLSSSGDASGAVSPSASHTSGDIPISPAHQQQLQLQQYQQSLLQQNGLSNSILNGALTGCVDTIQRNAALLSITQQQQQQQQQQLPPPTTNSVAGAVGGNVNALNGLKQLTAYDQHLAQQQKNKEVELYSERVRLTSGCNGIFSRRLDFSSFNLLPKTRLNSYQVKIEDEGNHGNDETRLFILSSLAQSQMSRVACILCEEPMLVFDRYPLVDGSFFLSPRKHATGCIEVKYEGRTFFLTCVCMACLDGTSTNRAINCRFCSEIWDGSNLVLGTMYAYDIFAAMPCCAERFKCNSCFKMVMHPQQRLNFYSDYSHSLACQFCGTLDTHFVKPLSFCYTKGNVARHQAIA